jgi:3-methylcrotonyl-CoA carboxylase alpha subunit
VFQKILIANRGEIACRVARTARRMGIRTVAVYSEADRAALHVAMADEAVAIGPAPARESYLVAERLIEAARATGARAIHPGYGFLSENAAFAEACAAADLIFIGPPAAAIRAMGDKSAAKALMEKVGVPVVPGYHGADQSEGRLLKETKQIGYPVLIKPSAGGGGKGMRVVSEHAAFAASLRAAKREAVAAFGDERVLVERYLTKPRHIEVQVFGDRVGNLVHLFERDCSIQRRHQKVIEEAPAPCLRDEQLRALGEVAISAARAVGYIGAGTVEFIVEGDAFYFMEMNTRLQVEHPVTEAITGLDLVEWQLRVAAGEALPLRQEEIARRGHAIEARLYAEDPARNFLPSTGRLTVLTPPRSESGIRVDTGVRAGDAISIHYDPLIAKLIAWGEDRDTAVARLSRALAEYQIGGLTTNREFLYRVASDPAYRAGEIDTGFIDRHRAALIPPPAPAPSAALAAASLIRVLAQAEMWRAFAAASGDPHSPWHGRDGWRLNGATYQDLRWSDGTGERAVRVHYRGAGYHLEIGNDVGDAEARWQDDGGLALTLDGAVHRVALLQDADPMVILLEGIEHRLSYIDPLQPKMELDATGGRLTAPMPGKVIEVTARAGKRVKQGEALLVLEAMKMEHTIVAPADGIVERVHFAPGDLVEEGAALIAFAADGKEAPDEPSR